jgi:hypothetical protein
LQGVLGAYLGFLTSTSLSAIAGEPEDVWTAAQERQQPPKHVLPLEI